MMRFRFKAAGAVVAIAAFGAVSLAPRVVHANSSPLDVVAFSAPTTAGTLTPVKAVLNGTGGGGSYQFSSNNPSPLPVAGCFGVSVETASPEVAASCTIASPSGTYTNIVCGTGMAGDAGGTVTENA